MNIPIWTTSRFRMPDRFKHVVPLYQVIASYTLRRGPEFVEVARVFSSCQESTRICFANRLIQEQVSILEGKIQEVHSNFVVDINIEELDLNTKRGQKLFQQIFSPPKTPRPQYVHIKGYAPELRLLPYQSDLEAIYQGSGIFRREEIQ